jgi:hypothetical protein
MFPLDDIPMNVLHLPKGLPKYSQQNRNPSELPTVFNDFSENLKGMACFQDFLQNLVQPVLNLANPYREVSMQKCCVAIHRNSLFCSLWYTFQYFQRMAFIWNVPQPVYGLPNFATKWLFLQTTLRRKPKFKFRK